MSNVGLYCSDSILLTSIWQQPYFNPDQKLRPNYIVFVTGELFNSSLCGGAIYSKYTVLEEIYQDGPGAHPDQFSRSAINMNY